MTFRCPCIKFQFTQLRRQKYRTGIFFSGTKSEEGSTLYNKNWPLCLPRPWINQPVILILNIEQFISGSSTTCDFRLFRFSLDMISKFQDAIVSLSPSRLGIRWVFECCRNDRRKFKLAVPLYRYNKGLQFFFIWTTNCKVLWKPLWSPEKVPSSLRWNRTSPLIDLEFLFRLHSFYKNILFPSEAESPYFSADFGRNVIVDILTL